MTKAGNQKQNHPTDINMAGKLHAMYKASGGKHKKLVKSSHQKKTNDDDPDFVHT